MSTPRGCTDGARTTSLHEDGRPRRWRAARRDREAAAAPGAPAASQRRRRPRARRHDRRGNAGDVPPLVGKRWAIAVDVDACVREQGCTACTTACHAAHNVPHFENPKDEVKWIWKEPFAEALPDEKNDYLPDRLREAKVLVFCNHCEEPAAPACAPPAPPGSARTAS